MTIPSRSRREKLSITDVFALYRDHYEGTEFDLTKGVAAGPYGDPNRFVGPYDGAQNNISDEKLFGAWERAISIFCQGYITVSQARLDAPASTSGVCWFGPDVAYTTCFAPFPSKVLNLPAAYQTGIRRSSAEHRHGGRSISSPTGRGSTISECAQPTSRPSSGGSRLPESRHWLNGTRGQPMAI
ncbi:MAG TPA: C69 family dipeptidase [Allosphingosinicella sp.]